MLAGSVSPRTAAMPAGGRQDPIGDAQFGRCLCHGGCPCPPLLNAERERQHGVAVFPATGSSSWKGLSPGPYPQARQRLTSACTVGTDKYPQDGTCCCPGGNRNYWLLSAGGGIYGPALLAFGTVSPQHIAQAPKLKRFMGDQGWGWGDHNP